tara:strand:+ start:16118 stop:16567 length:450 start_codon:yes stop_codon:yes gene_type:complete
MANRINYLNRGFGLRSDRRVLLWNQGTTWVEEGGPVVQEGGRLDLNGGFKLNHITINIIDTPYKVRATDYFVGVDSSKGVVTVELPTAVSVGAGFTIFIKDEGGKANVNNIKVTTPSRETLDGADTLIISTEYAGHQLYTDGINWFVFS